MRQGDEGSGKGMQKYIGSNQFHPALGLSYAVNIYKVIRQCGSISVRFRMLLNMEQYNRSTIMQLYFHAKCQFTGKLRTSSTWSCGLSLRSGDSERASHSGGGEEGGGGGGEGEEWRWGGGED